MTEMWRLFIAIELPPNIVAGLSEIQNSLKKQVPPRAVKWVDPKGIHLTLKFLGDVPVVQRDMLQKALLETVQVQVPFVLTAGGLGCFPNTKRPRVVWVGLHEMGQNLVSLRDAVESQISPLGYPTEDRPFSPHLTLGRIHQEARREDLQRVGAIIEQASFETVFEWQVVGVSLMRSELKPGGAVYSELFHAPLKV